MNLFQKLAGFFGRNMPDGSSVMRHRQQSGRSAFGDIPPSQYEQQIRDYMDALFPGRETNIFHEIISEYAHVDVFVMNPTEESPFYVLYTVGMSSAPMYVPKDMEDRKDNLYGEVYLLLPRGWDFSSIGAPGGKADEQYYWPIRCLKLLARYPHQYRTYLGAGHTIPNGANYEPLDASVGFTGMVLMQYAGDTAGFRAQDGNFINLLHAVPLYTQEMQYKLKYGLGALGDRFEQANISLVLDPKRQNTCESFTEWIG